MFKKESEFRENATHNHSLVKRGRTAACGARSLGINPRDPYMVGKLLERAFRSKCQKSVSMDWQKKFFTY